MGAGTRPLSWGYDIEVARTIKNMIGDYLDMDESPDLKGLFMRIQISIDIHNPLIQGRRVRFQDRTIVKFSFRYERLGSFYYLCGMLDHIDRDCDLASREDMVTRLPSAYGASLRAKSWKPFTLLVERKERNELIRENTTLADTSRRPKVHNAKPRDEEVTWMTEIGTSLDKVSLSKEGE